MNKSLVFLRERYTGRVLDSKYVDARVNQTKLYNLFKRNGMTLSVVSDGWAISCYNKKTFKELKEIRYV